MARIAITVCDICGTSEGLTEWAIRGPDGGSWLELCEEHSAPVETLWDRGTKRPVGTLSRATRAKLSASKNKVTTLEEIEALKRQRK